VYADLIHLKTYPAYAATFTNGTINYSLSDTIKWQNISGPNLQAMVVGNFGLRSKTSTVTFPSTGKWFSYLTSDSITVNSTAYSITLNPGQYFVYTNKQIKNEVLAVSWLSFVAQKSGAHAVTLNWSAKGNINNDHYDIERSSDGISFAKIGSVKAIQSDDVAQYHFDDTEALPGNNYYRLKQVDKDGSYQYSSIQKVNLYEAVKHWNLYPNPAKNNTTLFALNSYTKAGIAISDMNGKIVYRTTVTNIVAGQQFIIPVQQLAKGLYIIKITTDQDTDTQKLIVE
jgi:hypothetical protein